ncbi:DUF1572 domain-containing protein [Pedobacter sp.]|uniref:DUF1572 domain-containing protein n=1 Tax=Pedobacter sp. TaxID=1411316 RepID=UPI003BAA3DED
MSRSIILAGRLREVFLNGFWIANTNYQELLKDLTWQQAVQKVGSLNTIAALTFHINYYLKGFLDAFESGQLQIHDKYSFDLPPINSQIEWNKLVSDFLDNSEAFVQKVEKMNDEELEKPFFEEKYGTFLRNIEGVIEHSYYHLGQISLIRKIVS